MTKNDFAVICRILTNELFISSEDMDSWKVIGKCDKDDVLRYLHQFRSARKMGIRMTPDPAECKEWCEERHGIDPYIWEALEEIRHE